MNSTIESPTMNSVGRPRKYTPEEARERKRESQKRIRESKKLFKDSLSDEQHDLILALNTIKVTDEVNVNLMKQLLEALKKNINES